MGVHAGTISRALKVLEAKGWIDLELIQVRIKLQPKGALYSRTNAPPQVLSTDNSVVCRQQQMLSDDPGVVYKQQALSTDNTQPPEPLPSKDLTTDQIYKIDQDQYLDQIDQIDPPPPKDKELTR